MSAQVETAVVDSGGVLTRTGKRKHHHHHHSSNKEQIGVNQPQQPAVVRGKAHLNKKHKCDETMKHCKIYRKKSHSGNTKFAPPYKRRKKDLVGGGHNMPIIPPTKFLLGGNIRDPLNLNSLRDEEVNRRMNAVTPESSPLPTPQHRKGEVEVLIPPNLSDPLNLGACEDDDLEKYEATLISTNLRTGPGPGGGVTAGGGPGGVGAGTNHVGGGNKKKKKWKKKSRSSTGSGKEDNADVKSDESKLDESSDKDISLTEQSATGPPPSKESSETTPQVTSDEGVETVTSSENVPLSTDKAAEEPAQTQVTKSVLPSTEVSVVQNQRDFKKPKERGSESRREVRRLSENKDKIVSPVIPQPGASSWTHHHHHHGRFHHHYRPAPTNVPLDSPVPGTEESPAPTESPSTGLRVPARTPKFKERNLKFQYGNYNRYYGYRNPNQEVDPRLKLLANRSELFRGKDVLDIGCNTGHITLSVARDFGAKSVVGMDLDKKLVAVAKANVKHYMHPDDTKSFPVSMPALYGSLDLPDIPEHSNFPHNVSFIQGNYVLANDVLLSLETPQFDTILCLSVTKWFHLNWGDAGLKRTFKRMWAQLRPGGALVLEAQAWASYKRKKNLSEAIWRNYNSIEFLPGMFTQYLLTEVGFSKCEVIGSPIHPSKGFQRPIKIFIKGQTTPSPQPVLGDCKTEDKIQKDENALQSVSNEQTGHPSLAHETDKPCIS